RAHDRRTTARGVPPELSRRRTGGDVEVVVPSGRGGDLVRPALTVPIPAVPLAIGVEARRLRHASPFFSTMVRSGGAVDGDHARPSARRLRRTRPSLLIAYTGRRVRHRPRPDRPPAERREPRRAGAPS